MPLAVTFAQLADAAGFGRDEPLVIGAARPGRRAAFLARGCLPVGFGVEPDACSRIGPTPDSPFCLGSPPPGGPQPPFPAPGGPPPGALPLDGVPPRDAAWASAHQLLTAGAGFRYRGGHANHDVMLDGRSSIMVVVLTTTGRDGRVETLTEALLARLG